LGHVDELK
jgi:hypothetical protein